jgi:uncharacterized damage-inducible protein DinB
MVDLKYPIGKFEFPGKYQADDRKMLILEIALVPQKLKEALRGFSSEQMDISYRPGGWTVRQLVSHIADSHINAYTRFKFGLTEDTPDIKLYDQEKWVGLGDTLNSDVNVSITLIEALHQKWVVLLESLNEADFMRTIYHPENGIMTLDNLLGLYEWHGRHHVAHIVNLRKRIF